MPLSPDDEPTDNAPAAAALDNRLASLLDAVEAEPAPERLLELARRLQDELKLSRQRRTPN